MSRVTQNAPPESAVARFELDVSLAEDAHEDEVVYVTSADLLPLPMITVSFVFLHSLSLFIERSCQPQGYEDSQPDHRVRVMNFSSRNEEKMLHPETDLADGGIELEDGQYLHGRDYGIMIVKLGRGQRIKLTAEAVLVCLCAHCCSFCCGGALE